MSITKTIQTFLLTIPPMKKIVPWKKKKKSHLPFRASPTKMHRTVICWCDIAIISVSIRARKKKKEIQLILTFILVELICGWLLLGFGLLCMQHFKAHLKHYLRDVRTGTLVLTEITKTHLKTHGPTMTVTKFWGKCVTLVIFRVLFSKISWYLRKGLVQYLVHAHVLHRM